MATVQRANVVLDVKDSEVDRYLNKGFNVVDEKGNVIQDAKPTTLEQYQKAFAEQKRLNEKLQIENEKLKKEIEVLKSAKSSTDNKEVTKKPKAKKAE